MNFVMRGISNTVFQLKTARYYLLLLNMEILTLFSLHFKPRNTKIMLLIFKSPTSLWFPVIISLVKTRIVVKNMSSRFIYVCLILDNLKYNLYTSTVSLVNNIFNCYIELNHDILIALNVFRNGC
jgi:membrane-associated HD superfamily phosphohydrolase